jgi:hypothetical protein
MTSKLTGQERAVVTGFAVLSAATCIALLNDLQVLALRADETIVTEVVGLVRRFLAG